MKGEEMMEFAVFREGAWKAKQHHRMKEGVAGEPEPQPGALGGYRLQPGAPAAAWGTEEQRHSERDFPPELNPLFMDMSRASLLIPPLTGDSLVPESHGHKHPASAPEQQRRTCLLPVCVRARECHLGTPVCVHRGPFSPAHGHAPC